MPKYNDFDLDIQNTSTSSQLSSKPVTYDYCPSCVSPNCTSRDTEFMKTIAPKCASFYSEERTCRCVEY